MDAGSSTSVFGGDLRIDCIHRQTDRKVQGKLYTKMKFYWFVVKVERNSEQKSQELHLKISSLYQFRKTVLHGCCS